VTSIHRHMGTVGCHYNPNHGIMDKNTLSSDKKKIPTIMHALTSSFPILYSKKFVSSSGPFLYSKFHERNSQAMSSLSQWSVPPLTLATVNRTNHYTCTCTIIFAIMGSPILNWSRTHSAPAKWFLLDWRSNNFRLEISSQPASCQI